MPGMYSRDELENLASEAYEDSFVDQWQEHCDYEANAHYDYLSELSAEHMEDPATLLAEAEAADAEWYESIQDRLEISGPQVGSFKFDADFCPW